MNKTIHYIWLGGKPKSKLICKCIQTWREKMPDWQIKEWNESNLDLDINTYCRDAYNSGRYAFASDVLRFSILSKYGGLYMDVDVEILKPIDDLLEKHEAFSGFEYNDRLINPGLILYSKGPHNSVIDRMLESYQDSKFEVDELMPQTVCERMTELLILAGMRPDGTFQTVENFTVFPATYFCPTNNIWSVQLFSDETRTIHHYNASWLGGNNIKTQLKKVFCKAIGPKMIKAAKRLRDIIRRK